MGKNNNFGDFPVVLEATQVMSMFENMLDTYRDITVSTEKEKTEREKIREQARVMIAQNESDIRKQIQKINADKEVNLKILDNIGLLMTRPQLDEECCRLCELFLKYLR